MNLSDLINQLNNRVYNTVPSNNDNYMWDPSRASDGNNFLVKATWQGEGSWADYNFYPRLMNWPVRSTYLNANLGNSGNTDIYVSIPRVLNINQWMGQCWEFIKDMPANQFIFPGTHDTLTGYNVKGIGATNKSTTQSRKLDQQLQDGCRFFDIRFCWNKGAISNVLNSIADTVSNANTLLQESTTALDISQYYGVHSGILFDINVPQFLTTLFDFLFTNTQEVVAINLSLYTLSFGFIGDDKLAPNEVYIQFISELIDANMMHMIIPSGNANDTLAQLTANGGRIMIFVDDDVDAGEFNQYFWVKKKEACCQGYTSSITPQEWYSVILETNSTNGQYLKEQLSSDNVFNYLSMTQTDGVPNDVTQKLNGILADWILYANPDTQEDSRPPRVPTDNIDNDAVNQLDINHFKSQYYTLPYKPYTKADGSRGFMKNYNLISMDYYERSPFIINCITQNLIVSQQYQAPAPPPPVIDSKWFGTYNLQTRYGGEYGTVQNFGTLNVQGGRSIILNGNITLNILSVNGDTVTWNAANGYSGTFTFILSQNKQQFYWNDITFTSQGNCLEGEIIPPGEGQLDFRGIATNISYVQVSN